MKKLSIFLAFACCIFLLSAAPKAKRVPLRVMSFNLLYGSDRDTTASWRDTSNAELRKRYKYPWPKRKEAFKEMFDAYYPEVAGFNEPFPNQQAWIRAKLHKDYDYYTIPDTACTNHGLTAHATGCNMIAWKRDRLEPRDTGYFWLSDTPDVPTKYEKTYWTSAIWMRFYDRKAERTFVFCSAHTQSGSTEYDNEIRIKQTNLVLSRLKAVVGDDETYFIAGDLNAANAPKPANSKNCDTQLSLLPFYEAGMLNAREESPKVIGGPSWNAFGKWGPRRPHFNLDHIFYHSSTIVPIKYITVDEDWGVDYISDHYPIVFECKY